MNEAVGNHKVSVKFDDQQRDTDVEYFSLRVDA